MLKESPVIDDAAAPVSICPEQFQRNSAVVRVLRAVSQGAKTTESVADKAGVTVSHARTCLTRLRQKGYVRSIAVKAGQRGRFSYYEPVGVTCILADVWK